MSKRGAQLALGSHASEPPLLRQKTEEEEDLTLVFPDEVLGVILKMVVLEEQPGLAQPVRLVCRRWNALLEARYSEWRVEALTSYGHNFATYPAARAAALGMTRLLTHYLEMYDYSSWHTGTRGWAAAGAPPLDLWTCALTAAAGAGHLPAIRLLKSRYTDPVAGACSTAAALGQRDALELLRAEWSTSEADNCLYNALLGKVPWVAQSPFNISRGPEGRMEVIRLMREWGAAWVVGKAVGVCIARGDVPMLRAIWESEWTPPIPCDPVDMVRLAGAEGNVEVLEFLKEELCVGMRPEDLKLAEAMHRACHGDHLDAMRFLKEWGATPTSAHLLCEEVTDGGPAYELMRSWL
jgi:hypothetical protein